MDNYKLLNGSCKLLMDSCKLLLGSCKHPTEVVFAAAMGLLVHSIKEQTNLLIEKIEN